MPAAKRKQTVKAEKAKHLTLTPQRDVYQDEDIPVDSSVHADLTLDVTEGEIRVRLEIPISIREWQIARGEPIQGTVDVPDYEAIDPSSHWRPLPVNVDKIEALGLALVKLGQEARRHGFTAPTQEG